MLDQASRAEALRARRGFPPCTAPALPHRQLTQNGPAALGEELRGRARALPGVVEGPMGDLTPPGTRSFLLEPGWAKGPERTFLAGSEFAHLHPDYDGSLHLALPRGFRDEVVARGWGEIQVDAGLIGSAETRRGSPIFFVMVYGPRDEDELETVWRIFRASYAFARGAAGMDPADEPPVSIGRRG